MLRSLMMTQARKIASDTDATNPMHSDTELESFIDAWMIDLAGYIKWPRASQTITFAQGDGPNSGSITNAKNLNLDMLTILSVYFENTTTSVVTRLKPRREDEMQAENASWRYATSQSLPTYYVLLANPTEGTGIEGQSTVTLDVPTSEARTMRIHYIQSPAASTTTTNSPIVPAKYHIGGVWYVVSMMLAPRSAEKADFYMQKYMKDRAKQKALSAEEADESEEVWDYFQV